MNKVFASLRGQVWRRKKEREKEDQTKKLVAGQSWNCELIDKGKQSAMLRRALTSSCSVIHHKLSWTLCLSSFDTHFAPPLSFTLVSYSILFPLSFLLILYLFDLFLHSVILLSSLNLTLSLVLLSGDRTEPLCPSLLFSSTRSS